MVLAAFFHVPIYLPSRFGLQSDASLVRMPERCTPLVESAYNDVVRTMQKYWGASAAAEPAVAASSSSSTSGLDGAPRLPNSEVAERMSSSESELVRSLEELPLPCRLSLCCDCVPVSSLRSWQGSRLKPLTFTRRFTP
ncbi:unnamed protein product [Symbiodinium sp. CCMP2592]|nr:unnamed protein product [Symbiodinium sp. CCMP2592]CAE6965284.1 unnamed protein product [Symbiodinium sp. CCMP2592]CAE7787616.1 unnamed protein product [Symbiodinium sp. CCMP2592]